MIVYSSQKEKLTLSDDPISAGSGGEGEIHSVLSKPARFGEVCVKIYFIPKRTSSLEQKIKYMVANPPATISPAGSMIGWPLEVVYDLQGHFLGFVMPLAFSGSEKLIQLTSTKLSKRLNPIWADKFDRSLGAVSMIARLKLICNIAIPIHVLHSTERFVLKDFKPENVLITPNGKVTLVDMDSVQITENGRLLFPGTAATPNYMPPEYYMRHVGKNINVPIEKSWDYFAIGVVFYQLIFGIHPYNVTPLVMTNSESNEIYQNIARNLFPFGANAARIKAYPAVHNNFNNLPSTLQLLFKAALSDKGNERPTPEAWVKVLKKEILKAPKPHTSLFGTIEVRSIPSYARVTMDGKYQGTTPIDIKATEGTHILILSYSSDSRTYAVVVDKGKTKYLSVNLNANKDDQDNNQNSSKEEVKYGCFHALWPFLLAGLIITMCIIIGSNS